MIDKAQIKTEVSSSEEIKALMEKILPGEPKTVMVLSMFCFLDLYLVARFSIDRN